MCVCVRVYSCACNFCLEVNVEVRIGLLNQLASQKSFDVLQSEDVKLWVVSTRETMNSFMAAKEWTLRNAMPQCLLILQSSGCTDVEGHWSCKAPCEVSTFSIVLHHQPKHCFLAGWHWQAGPRLHFPDWLCFLFSCLTLCPDDSINLNLMRKEDAFCMLTFGIIKEILSTCLSSAQLSQLSLWVRKAAPLLHKATPWAVQAATPPTVFVVAFYRSIGGGRPAALWTSWRGGRLGRLRDTSEMELNR